VMTRWPSERDMHQPDGDTRQTRQDRECDVAAHHHHAAVEHGAFHAEQPIVDPATEHGGEVDQPAVRADDPSRRGLRQLETAFGDRVIEVIAG
jgi:hypothetical protein